MKKSISAIVAGLLSAGSALAYTAVHSASDISDVATDNIVEFGAQVYIYMGIIVVLIVLGILAAKMKFGRKR